VPFLLEGRAFPPPLQPVSKCRLRRDRSPVWESLIRFGVEWVLDRVLHWLLRVCKRNNRHVYIHPLALRSLSRLAWILCSVSAHDESQTFHTPTHRNGLVA
jgi:hypothetical protein